MTLAKKESLVLSRMDSIKGLLTLAVLVYHSILAWSFSGWHNFSVETFLPFEYLCHFLLKFHTPAFTFLSGYLFYYLRYEKGKYRTPRQDIPRRAKRLLIPYGLLLLWVIPFHFLFEGGTVKRAFVKYVLAVAPTQLWFLVMLFGVFVIFYLISDRLPKRPVVNFLVFYGIYGCATVGAMVLPDYFQIWTILKSLLYFYFGYAVRQGLLRKPKKALFYIVMALAYAALIYVDYKYLSAAASTKIKMLSAALDPITSLIGIAAFVFLFSRLSCVLERSKLFALIKRYNFTIYLFHQQLVYIPLRFLPKQTPTILLAGACVLIALLGSLGISMVLDCFSVTRTLFGLKTTKMKSR
ncbi:MAG: acyltransferase [Oscillospiraceae bacterium]|nr:acyltransferase [Oscillospiraceae bacterium]